MDRKSDKVPPLGYPGGPCHVVQRIEDEVRNLQLKDPLQEKVEEGNTLTNSEARKVYDLEDERGPGGMIKKFITTSHSQYRMDLRGITVPEIRLALKAFQKDLNDWKSRKDLKFRYFSESFARGESVEYLFAPINLFIVFQMVSRDTAKIVTTYWKGLRDPAAPYVCQVSHSHRHGTGYRNPNPSNFQTFVKNPTPGRGQGDTGDTKDKTEKYPVTVLPSPPWKREKPFGKPEYNTPGWSGTGPDEKSIHKDRVRTPGEPGKTPKKDPGPKDHRYVRRRQDVTAFERQRKQRGEAKRYMKKWYRKNKNRVKRRMKTWYRRNHVKTDYKRRDKINDRWPKRNDRRPSGGYYNPAQRTKDWREEQKKASDDRLLVRLPLNFWYLPDNEMGLLEYIHGEEGIAVFRLGGMMRTLPLDTFLESTMFDEEGQHWLFQALDILYQERDELPVSENPDPFLDPEGFADWFIDRLDGREAAYRVKYRPDVRQKRQTGQEKARRKRYNKLNRLKQKTKSRKRYKKLKRDPGFKRQQKIRRKHPERFKRRLGQVWTAPEIAFVIGQGRVLGYVHGVSPMTGVVTFVATGNNLTQLESLPVQRFLDSVVFLTEQDMDSMFELIDTELGPDAYDEIPPTPVDQYMIDPSDDDLVHGTVNLPEDYEHLVRRADFYYEKRPPASDSENYINRADDRKKPPIRPDRLPGTKVDPPYVPHPGPIKTIPDDKNYQNRDIKKFATRIPEIQQRCTDELHQKARQIPVKLKRTDTRNAMWHFAVKGSKGIYTVKVKALKKGNIRSMAKADVLVSCSCPFWQWQGPEHHAKVGDYLYGRPRGTASVPDIKDPTNEHGACKHILAVFNHILANKWDIPTQRGKRGSRYLADILVSSAVWVSHTHEKKARELAARYIERVISNPRRN